MKGKKQYKKSEERLGKEFLKKILQEVVQLQNIEKLVEILYKKQNVNEFLIAKKLGLTINQTRNILYKLADEGLISFIRKKDKKKGGWYTYFWTLETKKALLKYKEKIESIIKSHLQTAEQRKKERFYYCKNCGREYDEENALLLEYTCEECGEILEIKNHEEILRGIEKEIKKLEEILAMTKKELDLISEKEQIIRDKKLKREQKKKEKLKKIKREEKKANKKITKKKKISPKKKKKLVSKKKKGKIRKKSR